EALLVASKVEAGMTVTPHAGCHVSLLLPFSAPRMLLSGQAGVPNRHGLPTASGDGNQRVPAGAPPGRIPASISVDASPITRRRAHATRLRFSAPGPARNNSRCPLFRILPTPFRFTERIHKEPINIIRDSECSRSYRCHRPGISRHAANFK